MHTAVVATLAATAAAVSNSTTLSSLCTISNVQSLIPANGTLLGLDLLPSTVTANAVYNATLGGGRGSTTTDTTAYNYCNVTVSYTHSGKNDLVVAWYTFPEPAMFKSRFYVGGGGGYSLSSDPTGGVKYGAVAGVTDAGYEAFTNAYNTVALAGNGSLIYDNMHMFGYKALGEMTIIGKALTKAFYSIASEAKLYTYFEGCSDGGREGWSQVQRFGEEYDGVVVGAPAFRYAQQQINHLTSGVIEQTLGHYPSTCEMDKLVNLTITACDPLDGRTDGVVSRTDLCKLHFNLTSTIGTPYSCAASTSGSGLGFGFGERRKRQTTNTTTTIPAQNGTITAKAVEVASQILTGLLDSQDRQAYVPWQPASSFEDASTTYDSSTNTWGLKITSLGGEFVAKFVQGLDLDNLPSLEGVTYDTLVSWMNTAMIAYGDTLQTTLPDLSVFQGSGGKILHYHGESDDSVPPASSVHYYDSVRTMMYPSLSYDESVSELNGWYRLFMIPGAAHCSVSSLQNGPYPMVNMETMIEWVEKGTEPERLAAVVSAGDNEGQTQQLCSWPLRPVWGVGNGNGTVGGNVTMGCVYHQESIDSWTYVLDAFKLPVF